VVLRNISHVNPDSHWAWLVGSYDGVIGWMGLAWICLIIVAYWMPTWRDSCEARADSR